jgi:hypothetical protein
MLINQPAMLLNLLSIALMTLLVATALQTARFLARLSPYAQKRPFGCTSLRLEESALSAC